LQPEGIQWESLKITSEVLGSVLTVKSEKNQCKKNTCRCMTRVGNTMIDMEFN
jgi:hypothetical protein